MYTISIAPYSDFLLGGVAFFVSVYVLVYVTVSAHWRPDNHDDDSTDDDHSTTDDGYYGSRPSTAYDRGEFVWRRSYTVPSLLLLLYTVAVATVYSLLFLSFLLLSLLFSSMWSVLVTCADCTDPVAAKAWAGIRGGGVGENDFWRCFRVEIFVRFRKLSFCFRYVLRARTYAVNISYTIV